MSAPLPPQHPAGVSGLRERRRKRRKRPDLSRWFVRAIVFFGLLSALALVIYGVTHVGNANAEWIKLSDTLAKRGEPVRLVDMKPPDVPADKNFFDAALFNGLSDNAPTNTVLQQAIAPVNGASVSALLAAATQDGGVNLDIIADAMQQAGLVDKKPDFLLAGDRVRSGMTALGLDFARLQEAAARRPSAPPSTA